MNRLAGLLLALHFFVAGGAPVFAQQDQDSGNEPAATVTVVPTRSFVLDYLIVGGLVVAALFAVCRSGQRH
jgi:hypothetical protein